MRRGRAEGYGRGVQLPPRVSRTWTTVRGIPLDLILGTVFVAAGLLSTSYTTLGDPEVVYESRDALAFGLILAASVPYFVRRRAPLAVFLVGTSAVVLLAVNGYNEGVLPMVSLFGAYTVGAHRPMREALAAGGATIAFLAVLYFGDAPNFETAALLSNWLLFTAAILIGWNVQSRRQRLAALERGHEEAARAAAADERLRIAQELHDVVAHSLGVIAVQAGVGLHMLDNDREEARRALEAISTTSRGSLAEIRRLLGVVRDRPDGADYAPAPSLADLPRLVSDLTGLGLDVDLQVEGDLDGLPSGVELAIYRIVQEALTNTLRHAEARTVTVRIARTAGTVAVEVTDDGRASSAASREPSGHGLVGMRERAACYGGTLAAGPLAEGGWRVATELRVDAEVST